MKKSLVFSLLLLTAVIAAGCGDDFSWLPPGSTQQKSLTVDAAYVVRVGVAEDLNFHCTNNTALDLRATMVSPLGEGDDAKIGAERVGACGLTFTSSVLGKVYDLTVFAIGDHRPRTTKVYVAPNLTISTKKVSAKKPTQINVSGAGVAESLEAGSVIKWDYLGEGIGSIDKDTGLFTPTGVLGLGIVQAVLYDNITGTIIIAQGIIEAVNDSGGAYGIPRPPELPVADWPGALDSRTGLWADHDPNFAFFGAPVNFGTTKISDSMYVYYNFTQFPAEVPEAIAGYVKVDVTGDDYTVLKAGQWAEGSFSAFGITYNFVVIAPYDFIIKVVG